MTTTTATTTAIDPAIDPAIGKAALVLDADAYSHLRALWWAAKREQVRADLARIDPLAAHLRQLPDVLFLIETGARA